MKQIFTLFEQAKLFLFSKVSKLELGTRTVNSYCESALEFIYEPKFHLILH